MDDKEIIRVKVEKLKEEAQVNLKMQPHESIVWVQQITVCDKILYFIDHIKEEIFWEEVFKK